MSTKLPLPHLSLSLQPFFQHPLLLLAPALLLLMFASFAWRTGRALFALALTGGMGYGLYTLYQKVNAAMNSRGKNPWIVMPTLNAHHKEASLPVLPVQNTNYGMIAVLLVMALLILLIWGAVHSSGYSMGYMLNRLWVIFTQPIAKYSKLGDFYSFPNATLGTIIGEAEPGLPGSSEGAGKKVTLESKDRFLNMGIIGPIGSGKTYMTMKPMIYQDLESIAQGVMMNAVWVSPQPEPAVERYAESLGLTVRRIHIIDGQVGEDKVTNVRFNPLAGNDIDAIINNVNVVLNEQTGDRAKGEVFFDIMAAQATTDSLQLYRYLHGFDKEGNPTEIDMIGWYDQYLVQMDELFAESMRVQTVTHLEDKNALDQPLMESRSEWIRSVIWPKLTSAQRIILRRAAASIINEFGGNITGKNAEAYKNIIRGLRGKVRVLISSQYVQELLGTDVAASAERPNFGFETWIDPIEWVRPKIENLAALKAWKQAAPHGHKGELLSVITGQTETGKLVGRMILVFLQQAVLNRPGNDNDKPPVYTYVDEYASYATRSINEIRTQGRKHCHQMVIAAQSRAQIETVGRGYLETMEGSTRHWVYLSNLGAEDALSVSKLCGKVKRIKKSTSTRQIRLGGLGNDRGEPLVTKSEQEELVDRFSPQFIRYVLTENEVLYIGVKDRKGQNPIRMRITEPKENRALVKQLGKSALTSARPKKQRPISVYPRADMVARAKWPLFTIGNVTVYVYRWGLSVGRDMDIGHKTHVQEDYWVVDVNPPGLPGGMKREPEVNPRQKESKPVQSANLTDTEPAKPVTPDSEEPVSSPPSRPPLRVRTNSNPVPHSLRPHLTLKKDETPTSHESSFKIAENAWEKEEHLTRQSLRKSAENFVNSSRVTRTCPLDGMPMQLKKIGNREVWICSLCGHRIRAN